MVCPGGQGCKHFTQRTTALVYGNDALLSTRVWFYSLLSDCQCNMHASLMPLPVVVPPCHDVTIISGSSPSSNCFHQDILSTTGTNTHVDNKLYLAKKKDHWEYSTLISYTGGSTGIVVLISAQFYKAGQALELPGGQQWRHPVTGVSSSVCSCTEAKKRSCKVGGFFCLHRP